MGLGIWNMWKILVTWIDNSRTETFIAQSYSCYWPLILMLPSVKISLTAVSANAASGGRFSQWRLFSINLKRLLTQRFPCFAPSGFCAEFPTSDLREKKGSLALDSVALTNAPLASLYIVVGEEALAGEPLCCWRTNVPVRALLPLRRHCRTFATNTPIYRQVTSASVPSPSFTRCTSCRSPP